MARMTVSRRPTFAFRHRARSPPSAVEHLAIVDLDDVVAALDAEGFQAVGGIMQFRIRRR
jgi:hypothetical protein